MFLLYTTNIFSYYGYMKKNSPNISFIRKDNSYINGIQRRIQNPV